MTSGRRRLINTAYSATSTESLRGSVGSIRASGLFFYDFLFFHKFLHLGLVLGLGLGLWLVLVFIICLDNIATWSKP